MDNSILVVIVNGKKGNKILEFVHSMGITDVSRYYGRGTMQNKLRRMIEVGQVRKEILFISIPSDRETEIINSLNKEFLLERKNHGIAFIISKKDDYLDYRAIFAVRDKAEEVVEISQEAGYFGGTIIEGGEDLEKLSSLLDLDIGQDKELVLMILSSNNANTLSLLLKEKLDLQNSGETLVTLGVSKAVGLYEDSVFAGLE